MYCRTKTLGSSVRAIKTGLCAAPGHARHVARVAAARGLPLVVDPLALALGPAGSAATDPGRLVLPLVKAATLVTALAPEASLARMRERGAELAPSASRGTWKDVNAFFRSGGTGEWRWVPSNHQLRALTCWLDTAGHPACASDDRDLVHFFHRPRHLFSPVECDKMRP